jgi:hypothetical protein
MRDLEIQSTVTRYLSATDGDAGAALRIAVADLLDVHGEAELRRLALDHWVSRGYVRGPAREVLATAHARRALAEVAESGAVEAQASGRAESPEP